MTRELEGGKPIGFPAVDATGVDFYDLGQDHVGAWLVLSEIDPETGSPYPSSAEGVGGDFRFDPRCLRAHDLQQQTSSGARDRRMAIQVLVDYEAEYLDEREGDAPYGQPENFIATNRTTRWADTSGRVALPTSLVRLIGSEDQRDAVALAFRDLGAPDVTAVAVFSDEDLPEGVHIDEAGALDPTGANAGGGVLLQPRVLIDPGLSFFGQGAVDLARRIARDGGTKRDIANALSARARGVAAPPRETQERRQPPPPPAKNPAGSVTPSNHPTGYVWDETSGRVGLLNTLVTAAALDDGVFYFKGRESNRINRLALRSDAHVALDAQHTGAVLYKPTDVSAIPESTDGTLVKGWMLWDTSVANEDTKVGEEVGKWRPAVYVRAEDIKPPPPPQPPPYVEPPRVQPPPPGSQPPSSSGSSAGPDPGDTGISPWIGLLPDPAGGPRNVVSSGAPGPATSSTTGTTGHPGVTAQGGWLVVGGQQDAAGLVQGGQAIRVPDGYQPVTGTTATVPAPALGSPEAPDLATWAAWITYLLGSQQVMALGLLGGGSYVEASLGAISTGPTSQGSVVGEHGTAPQGSTRTAGPALEVTSTLTAEDGGEWVSEKDPKGVQTITRGAPSGSVRDSRPMVLIDDQAGAGDLIATTGGAFVVASDGRGHFGGGLQAALEPDVEALVLSGELAEDDDTRLLVPSADGWWDVYNGTATLLGSGGSSLPSGSANDVLYHDGSDWTASSSPTLQSLTIVGNLQVGEVIDPKGVIFVPQASNPSGLGYDGMLWFDGDHMHLGRDGTEDLPLGFRDFTRVESAATGLATIHTYYRNLDTGTPSDGIGAAIAYRVDRADAGDDAAAAALYYGWESTANSDAYLLLRAFGGVDNVDLRLEPATRVVRLSGTGGGGCGLELESRTTPASVTAGNVVLYTKTGDDLFYYGTSGEVALGGSGTSPPFVDTTAIAKGSADATKQVRLELDGLATATTRVLTVPDADGTIALTSDLAAYQPLDATLTALAGATTGADVLAYFDGADSVATTTLTAYVRTLLDDADAAAARTTLGLVIGANVQGWYQELEDIASLSDATGSLIVGSAAGWIELPVGADGQVLTADSTQTAGVKWAAGGGGGVTDHGALTGLSDDDHPQYLLADGTRALSAAWDAGSFQIRAETFQSDVATGTAPLVVASTTLVANLNADLLDGQEGSYYLDLGNATGTLALARFGTQVANRVLAGPTTGVDAAPTFRALVAADIPDLSTTYSLATHDHDADYAPLVHDHDADYQPLDADLTTIAGLAHTVRHVVISTGAAWETRALVAADLPDLSGTYAAAGHDHDADYQPLDAVLTDLAGLSLVGGDILYFDGTNLTRLAKGTDGQVLKLASGLPSWAAESGGGVTDHGALTGLGDDDHTQYLLANGTRAITGDITTRSLLPAGSSAYDLGSEAAPYREGYFRRLYVHESTGADPTKRALLYGSFTTARSLVLPDVDGTFWTSGNDGAGSGLDADLLDGQHAADFAAAGHDHDADYAPLVHNHDADYAAAGHDHDADYQPLDAVLTDLAGLTLVSGDILYFDGTNLARLAKGTDGQVLKLASGLPSWAASGGGGKPTDTSWGTNAETLAAEKTLTDSDDTYQALDPDGTDRAVSLPTLSASTPFFLIHNVGTSGNLAVELDGRYPLAPVEPGEAAWITNTGASGRYSFHRFASSGVAQAAGWATFWWRSSTNTSTNQHHVAQYHADVVSSLDNYLTEHRVPIAGDIEYLEWVTAFDGDQTFSVDKNGAASETGIRVDNTTGLVVVTGSIYRFRHESSTSVVVGDELQITLTSSTTTLNTNRVLAYVKQATTTGNMIRFGCGSTGANSFFKVEWTPGGTHSGVLSVNYETKITAPGAFADHYLSWNTSTGDNTTVVETYKNGAATGDQITFTGAAGEAATAGTSYARGDSVAIKHDSGTTPGSGTVHLATTLRDMIGLTFVGDSGSADDFLYYAAPQIGSTAATTINFMTLWTCPFARAVLVTYAVDAQNQGEAEIYKNGALAEDLGQDIPDGTVGVTAGTAFSQGDYLTVLADGEDDQRFTVYARVENE